MSKDSQTLSKEVSARESAMIVIHQYASGELSKGRYAYELISETYLNLISQA